MMLSSTYKSEYIIFMSIFFFMDEGKRTLSFIYVLAYQMKNGSQQTYSTMSGEKNQYFSI